MTLVLGLRNEGRYSIIIKNKKRQKCNEKKKIKHELYTTQITLAV